MRTSLLALYGTLESPPAAAAKEAREQGLRLESPVGTHWEVTQDFVDGYCRDLTPAGALVVAPDPTVGGATSSGIPFTDGVSARTVLSLPCREDAEDPVAARFWSLVQDVRRRTGDPALEHLFSSLHMVHAVPFALTDEDGEPVSVEAHADALPALREAGRRHLARVLRITRPQVIACAGRFAYEAVLACADDARAHHRELAAYGWSRIAAPRPPDGAYSRYPRADFGTFRARLLPVPEIAARVPPRAQAALTHLLQEVWT